MKRVAGESIERTALTRAVRQAQRNVTAQTGNREIAIRLFILGIRFKTLVTEKISMRHHHRTFTCVTAMNS
jgi:hypothetical protein